MTIHTVIPPGFATARFRFACVGVDHQMGFTIGCEPDTPESGLSAGAISTIFESNILDDGAGMGSAWTYLGVTLSVYAAGGLVELQEHAESLNGTFSPSTIPPNCSMLIQKRTGLAGRRNRGRIYFPPCMVTDLDVDASGSMGGALVTSHQVLWNGFHTAMADSFPTRLFHQYDDQTEAPGPHTDPTPITSFSVQSLLATQRRRLR